MTGAPTDYTAGDIDELYRLIVAAFQRANGYDPATWGQGLNEVTITGDIEWAGESRGTRSTTIQGINMPPVGAAFAAAVAAGSAAGRAARNTGPQGWAAQFRQLSATPAGYDAMRAAGVNASKETQRRWLLGEQSPGNQNRAALAEANRQVHADRASLATGRWAAAMGQAVDTFTREVEEVTQDSVRFIDVSGLSFQ